MSEDTKKTNYQYHDVSNVILHNNDDEHLTIRKTQYIPPDFLANLKRERDNSLNQKEGEYMRVASVPVQVHEQWLKEGFDMMKETPKAIVQRLQRQDLHAFITTKKQV